MVRLEKWGYVYCVRHCSWEECYGGLENENPTYRQQETHWLHAPLEWVEEPGESLDGGTGDLWAEVLGLLEEGEVDIVEVWLQHLRVMLRQPHQRLNTLHLVLPASGAQVS